MTLLLPTSQRAIFREWQLAVDQASVPQAVLLTGANGAGMLPLALGMVTYLQQASEGSILRGTEAANTRLSVQLEHPDVHYTFPVVGSKYASIDFINEWREAVRQNPYLTQSDWLHRQTGDNKQGNISNREIKEILRVSSLQRFTDGYKVVVIWGAEQLGKESNKLLKLIEEPPPKTLILLITTQFDRLLPTVTSRCRIFRLPPLSAQEVSAVLTDRGIASADADRLAYQAGGSIAQALRLYELQQSETSDGPDLAAWLRACYAGGGAALIAQSAALAALNREQQKHFVHRALRFVRELGVVLSGSNQPLQLDAHEDKVARKLAGLLSWPQLTDLSRELDLLLTAVERNANGKIAFTASSIRIHHILTRQKKKAAA